MFDGMPLERVSLWTTILAVRVCFRLRWPNAAHGTLDMNPLAGLATVGIIDSNVQKDFGGITYLNRWDLG
jgi:hypothetical protein